MARTEATHKLIIPSQLRRAREALQLTLEEVASELEVAAQSVSDWESGRSEPALGHLEALAKLYGRDVDYFLGGTPPPPERLEFRAPGDGPFSALSKEAKAVVGRFYELCRRSHELESLLGKVRKFELPHLSPSVPPTRAAAALRRSWQVGAKPIRNLRELVDARGFRIFELRVPADEFSGLSILHSDYGPCVLLNAGDVKGRRNFTLAHELAHLIYRHGSSACRIPAKLVESLNRLERKANQFAVELLLPPHEVELDFATRGLSETASAKELSPMYSKWGVSLQAMGYRLERLGLLRRGHTDNLVESRPAYFPRAKTPKWRRQLGNTFVETAFEAYHKNLVSIGRLAHSLGIPVRSAMEEVERRSK
jgi:Zn-dependent peptidase ImmA (M78 family)/transcriptional regulator with XRE-family HTH domain